MKKQPFFMFFIYMFLGFVVSGATLYGMHLVMKTAFAINSADTLLLILPASIALFPALIAGNKASYLRYWSKEGVQAARYRNMTMGKVVFRGCAISFPVIMLPVYGVLMINTGSFVFGIVLILIGFSFSFLLIKGFEFIAHTSMGDL